MKRKAVPAIVVVLLAANALFAVAQGAESTDELSRANLGLILDTPFLLQEELSYDSEYYGAYGDELVVYRYNADRLPVSIHYTDMETGARYLDAEITYRSDGRIATLVYSSYDDAGEEILYEDSFEFTDYTPTGPRLGTMTTEEGMAARMRLSYDERGRPVALDEDDAFGSGYYRRERYAWVEDLPGSLPYAVEVSYPLDGEVERFRYLYDARGRLTALDGVNVLQSDPSDVAAVSEWYSYESGTLDEIFGEIVPRETGEQTASLR